MKVVSINAMDLLNSMEYSNYIKFENIFLRLINTC